MIIEEEKVNIEGHLLHRFVMRPDRGVSERAVGLFYHGQGDYAERYRDILTPFTDAGIRCVLTDLPGHGYSPGRRGHAGNKTLLDVIITRSLSERDGLPYGVMGHSMGGLLAARHLVLSGRGELPRVQFAWLNAPLVRPGYGRSRSFLKWVRFLSHIFPQLTISTGITSEMCRKKTDSESNELDEESEGSRTNDRRALWHDRISLEWGVTLLEFGELLKNGVSEMSEDIPILLTQGGADTICPASITKEFFQELPQRRKKYVEFDGRLHELFSEEDGNVALSQVISEWLTTVLK